MSSLIQWKIEDFGKPEHIILANVVTGVIIFITLVSQPNNKEML